MPAPRGYQTVRDYLAARARGSLPRDDELKARFARITAEQANRALSPNGTAGSNAPKTGRPIETQAPEQLPQKK